MAARTRNRLARAQQTRARTFAAFDLIAQRKLAPRTAAEVAGCRNACAHHGVGAFGHPGAELFPVLAPLRRSPVVRIQLHVHVGVDQPRQRRGAAAVDLDTRGRQVGADGFNAPMGQD